MLFFLLKSAGVIIVSIAAALYTFQGNLLYLPTFPKLDNGKNGRYYLRTPLAFRLLYEDMWIQTTDGVKIHAWLIRSRRDTESAPTLVYFHGNAGNISHRLDHAYEFVENCGVNVVLVSYRGYGESEGAPSEPGLQRDAQAVLDALRARSDIDTSKIVLFGASLGGGVACYLAHENPGAIYACILENTFTSIEDMIDVVLPVLKPFKILCRNHWPNGERVPRLKCPLLFLSGARDELIPPSMMRRLFDTADRSAYKEMQVYPSGMHNDTWLRGGPKYYEDVARFLGRVAGLEAEGPPPKRAPAWGGPAH
eukprot:tig00000939_g5491.t1